MEKTKVEPKYEETAQKAAVWASSEEGQVAYNRAVEAGKEGVESLKEAERIGRERIMKIFLEYERD